MAGAAYRYIFGDCEVQPSERRLLVRGNEIALGARTLDLLILLLENAGKLVTKEQIFNRLWPQVVVEENNLHVHISLLRKVLGANKITTLSGRGYRFATSVDRLLDVSSGEKDGCEKLKILLVDDHALIRDALRAVIQELKTNCVVIEADNIQQARTIVAVHPDIEMLVLDLNLPDACGITFLKEMREENPQVPVVVVSAENAREKILQVLKFGILGFIPKSAPRQTMVNALQLIFSGGIYVPAEALAG
jgi:DNA-binding response OmpR family regulator